jgi:hypothetical protein
MHFKLILAFVEDRSTQAVLDAARKAGATGSTVINQARGEGVEKTKTFFGLALESQRDVIMLLVEEHLSPTSWKPSPRPLGSRRDPARGSPFRSMSRMRSASITRCAS